MACKAGYKATFEAREQTFSLAVSVFVILFGLCGFSEAKDLPLPPLSKPYSLNQILMRGEELFKGNNFREALIFYFESLDSITDLEMKSKIHFRIGECLEAIRRYDFSAYHYKVALRGKLPELLSARALEKLQHLPKLAQREEAMRLFNKALIAYRKKDIRGAIDDYLASLRLEPSLMAKGESGLIDDAIQYLTFLSESKDKEPQRLLKLATLLELKGEIEKSIETLKQILIIYPDSREAAEAQEKVEFSAQKKGSYLEFKRPEDALKDVVAQETPVLVETDLDFTDPGAISKELNDCAYTFRASCDQTGIPSHRFDTFSIILGKGGNQRDFLFKAEDGIQEKTISFDDGNILYKVTFREVNLVTGYIRDVFGEGPRPVPLFSGIKVNLVISRKE